MIKFKTLLQPLDRHLAAVLRFAAHTTRRTLALPVQQDVKRSAARITHLHS